MNIGFGQRAEAIGPLLTCPAGICFLVRGGAKGLNLNHNCHSTDVGAFSRQEPTHVQASVPTLLRGDRAKGFG